ncbi:unnamed protein product [Linum tenue]|uniref:Uncharacterized protein n=1 Tax=Linum tenue TaxID=586396 RepID=A0AAV0RGS5_9ROSI|nr:unnamed protein product [Linum tenue]
MQTDDLDSEWPSNRSTGPIPNLVVTAGNVLEVYVVRVQHGGSRESRNSGESKRGGLVDGLSGASLELVCLPLQMAFKDAKISVLEFHDAIHGLRTRSRMVPSEMRLRVFRGRAVGSGLIGDDDAPGSGSAISARVKSSEIFNLRDLDMKHIKGFVFISGSVSTASPGLKEEVGDIDDIHTAKRLKRVLCDALQDVVSSSDHGKNGTLSVLRQLRVVQVYERGARILDGSFVTPDLSVSAANSESGPGAETCTVLYVSIADP